MVATPGDGGHTGTEGMPNTIPQTQKYLKNILDEIYVAEAKTNGMTPDPSIVQATQEDGVIKLATFQVTGLGDYDTDLGYPMGAGSNSWESYSLECDRAISYRCDPKESILGGGLATVTKYMSVAMREQINPEIDAYRFAKAYSIIDANTAIKSTHIVKESAALDASEVLSAVIDGLDVVSEDTGIDSGLTIYMSSALRNTIHKSTEYDKVKDIGAIQAFNTDITNINGNNIVWVPKTRFYSAIDLNNGVTNAYSDTTTTPKTVDYTKYGFKKKSGGKPINFVITAPNTCMGIMAINRPKIITKEVNQRFDADEAMIRIWHDLIIPKNRQPGVYISINNS